MAFGDVIEYQVGASVRDLTENAFGHLWKGEYKVGCPRQEGVLRIRLKAKRSLIAQGRRTGKDHLDIQNSMNRTPSSHPSPPVYLFTVRTSVVGRDAALRRPRPRAAGGTLRAPRWLGHVGAPQHAARTAQRAVPTAVNRYPQWWRRCPTGGREGYG